MMRHSTSLALLAVLVSATASAQDVNVYSTTMAQYWKQDTPGFDKATFTPATEFLGIDATNLGTEALSLHIYGWGQTDLQNQSTIAGKNDGDLTYGYLQYNFSQANAVLKAGRFTVSQGVGNEQVDGVSARTDLKYGFSVSAFGGVPVVYGNLSSASQHDITFQRDFMFGARLAYAIPRMGELGVSYLQDGSHAAQNLATPEPMDFTRRQAAADVRLAPCAFITLSGRTVFDVAQHPLADPGTTPSSIAEHDYSATAKVNDKISVTGQFIERNFYAYYAGSTLPNLFNMNEKGMLKATGGNVTWAPIADLQLIADVRRTSREAYGDTTRYGGDARYNFTNQHLLVGAGYHKVNAFAVVSVDPSVLAYSLNHSEMRAWAMIEKGPYSASLDAIRLHYSDSAINPNLNFQSLESELVGSLGYQLTKGLKLSGDLSVEDTPIYRKQVMGLLRAEYRFGFAAQGGK